MGAFAEVEEVVVAADVGRRSLECIQRMEWLVQALKGFRAVAMKEVQGSHRHGQECASVEKRHC